MPGKLFLKSLGCDKNLVDSEMMLAILKEGGWTFTDEPEDADVLVVNSCCFIMDAKEESIAELIELGKLRKEGKCRALIAAGCLAQRYAEQMHTELPEVDALVGTSGFDHIAEAVDLVLKGTPRDFLPDINRPLYGLGRILSTGGHYAYLKIAEGCDKVCTYCAIPHFRGCFRSVPMELLLKEAEELVSGGVRELNLVAQECTRYGVDLYGKKSLPELLRGLCGIEGLVFIRLLYCYPEEIDDDLIEVMASEEKICKYLDMPMQHSEDRVLAAMGRRTRRKELIELVKKLRSRIPGICLRTSIIVGFPGESEEDFEQLLSFVRELRFEHLGVFCYSAEEGTKAAELDGQIAEEEKQRRRDRLMKAQQKIAFAISGRRVGSKLRCMVEGRLVDADVLVLRSEYDAPDVDGYVFVENAKEYLSGTALDVLITAAKGYDLIGEIAYESAQ